MKNKNSMPIKAIPYQHQIKAYDFVCDIFGLSPQREAESNGTALLMEMGTGKTITLYLF